jgi:hypothetical protein
MEVKICTVAFLVIMLSRSYFYPEDGDSSFLQNFGMHTRLYGVMAQKTTVMLAEFFVRSYV